MNADPDHVSPPSITAGGRAAIGAFLLLLSALVILGAGCDINLDHERRLFDANPPPHRPIPRNAPLQDLTKTAPERVAWGRRVFLTRGYDRVGLRDAKWDAGARRFIEDSLPTLVAGERPIPADQRIAEGRALVEAGCRDPLVLYLLGRALLDGTWDSAEPEFYLGQAVEGMKHVPYPRAVARWAASALYGRYEWRNEGIGLRNNLRPLEMKWFADSLVDGSFEPGDSAILLHQLDSGTGPDFIGRSPDGAAVAIAKVSWLEPWVRECILGMLAYQQAWKARGTGWARDVKDANWRRFAALVAEARQHLVEAARLRPDRPEPLFYMIRVAADDPVPGEDGRLWFDRLVALRFDSYNAYESILARLLPRWGGSYEEMLAFGRETLETGRFDTDVPLYQLRAITNIYNDQKGEEGGAGGTPIYDRPETYRTLVEVFEGFLKEPKRSGDKPRFESLWAVVADRAHRPAEALAHLAAAGFRLTGDAASHLEDETADEFVARVALAGGPAAEDGRAGDARRLAFDNAAALGAYRTALAKYPSPHAAPALRRWIVALEAEGRLEKGEWADLLPQSGTLDGWRPLLGTWKVEKDGALVGQAGARGLLITSDVRVGPRFEMRGKVELLSTSNGFFQAGFLFGHPSWSKDDWFSFRVKRNAREGSVAYFARFFYGPQGPPLRLTVPDSNEIEVLVDDGRMTARVNGERVQTDFVPRDGWRRNDRSLGVGLGGYSDENIWSMRFRDVRVRRLRP